MEVRLSTGTASISTAVKPGGPVFIVGAPRSGTTLLRVILDRHPAIAIPDETEFFRLVYERRNAFGDLADVKNRERLIDRYLATDRMRRLDLDLVALRETLMREGRTYSDFFASLLRFNAACHGKDISGEKSPRHALVTELLCEWFPASRILHLVRDPRDVAASMVRMPWATRSVVSAAREWRVCNLAALSSSHRPNYARLRYEDLIADPGHEIGRICAHLGVDPAPDILNAAEPASNLRWWGRRAHGKLSQNRIGRWRTELAAWQAQVIERLTAPLMDDFGYRPECPPPRFPVVAKANLESALEFSLQKVLRAPKIVCRVLSPMRLAQEERWETRADEWYMRLRHAAASPRTNSSE